MSKDNSLSMMDKNNLFHPITNLKLHAQDEEILILDRGEGIYVYDTNGKKYLEGLAGLWCTSLGYGGKELADAASEQMAKLGYASLFTSKSHEPAIRLSEKLIERKCNPKILPIGFPKKFIEHGTRDYIYKKYKMDPESVIEKIKTNWTELKIK